MTSIIIPTLNRAKDLAENLNRIGAFMDNHANFEIIVVDNGSSDDTAGAVEKVAKQYPRINLTYIFDAEPGLLTGRHRGFEASTGSILAFIDDDILISQTWLKRLSDLSNSASDYAFFTGPNLPAYGVYPPEWLKFFWRENAFGKECSWLSLLDFGNKPKEIPLQYIWGLNFIVRREAFIHTGGFHPDNITMQYQHFQGDGESGLIAKAKQLELKGLYDPLLLVHHQIGQERLTKAYFGNRSYYQGVCDSYTQLRKEYRTDNSLRQPNENFLEKTLKRNWKGKIVDQFPVVGDVIKKLKKPSIRATNSTALNMSSEAAEIFRFTKEQYVQGYEFHQKAFYSDPAVRQWVMREDYWDYKLPK